MKKTICVILSLTMLLFSAGCGQTAAPAESGPAAADAAAQETAAPPAQTPDVGKDAEREAPAAAETPEPTAPAEDAEQVDVDLTQLSSTMVYSEVYAMVYEPEQYIGKTVKMRGLFATQEYKGARLFACIIQDATACCSQGLEFELAEEMVYPDDYPAPGEEITVIGTFDSYTEDAGNGNSYIYLVLREARLL